MKKLRLSCGEYTHVVSLTSRRMFDSYIPLTVVNCK